MQRATEWTQQPNSYSSILTVLLLFQSIKVNYCLDLWVSTWFYWNFLAFIVFYSVAVCLCASQPARLLSPGSLVTLAMSSFLPHSQVIFCSGVTHCITVHPPTVSLLGAAFTVWLGITLIKQERSIEVTEKQPKEHYEQNSSIILEFKSWFFFLVRFCR